MSIIEDLKHQFKQGTALIKLIFINVAVFVLVHLIGLFIFFFTGSSGANLVVSWLALPSELSQLIFQPWTFITYMFLHQGFMHLMFNMLVLYFGGQIFLQFLDEKKLVATYLLGGFAGGLIYIITFNVFPVFNQLAPISILLGASASVIAVLIAAATYVPNFTVRLLFLGNVRLKYIAIFYLVLDLISIPQNNAGGHISHLGGAIFGFLFITQLKKGKDITLGFSKWLNYFKLLFSSRKNMRVVYKKPGKTKTDEEYNNQKILHQKKVDAILDKIAKSGYDSLSKDEKAFLFDASKK
ncbi:MAG: rhomboid family intramembrane serine protease [Vicingaceae bacterium]|nr:rhomboid family intramembrane serine protease [Vicingaceae bacterium]